MHGESIKMGHCCDSKSTVLVKQGWHGVAQIRDGDDPGGGGGHQIRGRAGALFQHDHDPRHAPLGFQPRGAAKEVARSRQKDARILASRYVSESTLRNGGLIESNIA